MKEFFSSDGKQKAKVRASVLTAGKKKTPARKEESPEKVNGTATTDSNSSKTQKSSPPTTNGQAAPAPNNVSFTCTHNFHTTPHLLLLCVTLKATHK